MSPARDPAAIDRALAEANRMRALAAALLRGPSSADLDDVLQEARLAAIGPHAPPPEELRPWLVRVVQRLVALVKRRRDRLARRERASARPLELRDDTHSPRAIAERLDLHRELLAAVTALPEPYRATITRRWLDGVPPRAIAIEQQLPIATVKTRLRRGLEKLRERLRDQHGGDDRRVDGRLGLLLTGLEGIAMTTSSKSGLAAAAAAAVVLLAGGSAWWLERHARETQDVPLPALSAPADAEAAARPDRTPASDTALLVERVPLAAPIAPDEHVAATGDPRRVASITGRVGGPRGPVAGATVELSRESNERLILRPWVAPPPASGPLRSTRTDAEGRFSFEGLARGVAFELVARADALVGTPRRGIYSGATDLHLGLAHAASIVVTVRDAAGQPVAGACVSAFLLDIRLPGLGPWHASSDLTGSATLSALPGGIYHVTVSTKGGDAPLASRVKVGVRSTVELPIVLGDGDILEGTVVDDATGEPIAGAELFGGWREGALARTDNSGRYRLVSVPRLLCETIDLVVRAPGSPPQCCPVAAPEALRYHGRPQLPDVLRIDRRSRQIRGRIVLPDGTPVAAAQVIGVAALEDTTFAVLDEALFSRTDDQGRFELAGLRVDRRHALLIRDGACAETAFVCPDAPLERGATDIDAIDLGEIVVERGVLVAGRVFDASGQPPRGARLELQPAELDEAAARRGEPAALASLHRRRRGYARNDGRFELPDLGAGHWKLVATWTDHATPIEHHFELRGDEEVVELELRAGQGLALTGRLVGPGTTPIDPEGLIVMELLDADDGSIVARAQPRDDGTFGIGGLPDRRFTLRLRTFPTAGRPGWFPTTLSDVRAGGPELELPLEPCLLRRGRVVDALGAPLACVRVVAISESGGGNHGADRTADSSRSATPLATATSDESGAFTLCLPLDASIVLEAWLAPEAGSDSERATTDAPPDGTTTLRWSADAPASRAFEIVVQRR